MKNTSYQARILHEPEEADGAARTFEAVLDSIRQAQERIAIHMYVWRSDEIGNQVGSALLEAAERGVKIDIIKDLGAMMYERIEMNRKSYLPREPGWGKRLWWKIITPTFPKTFVEDDFECGAGRDLVKHANVNLSWADDAHTHTKYYLFDDRKIITGSINIEDRHRKYFDYKLEIEGDGLGEHFRARESGSGEPDLQLREHDIEFVFNQTMAGEKRFEIKPLLLDLLSGAQSEVYIEVAYIGDPDIDAAIVDAAKRGVDVTLMLSERANIGNDNNYRAAERLYKSAPIKLYLTPKMIHAKMLAFDRRIVCSGSANISIFSMINSAELNILTDRPELVADFMEVADARRAASTPVTDAATLGDYNHVLARLQELHQKLKL